MKMLRGTFVLVLAASVAAQTDRYYLSAGDQQVVVVYQGGAQIARFGTGLQAYPIAVSNGEVRVAHTLSGAASGKAYDLAGGFLRTLQVRVTGVVFDATSDGTYNYYRPDSIAAVWRCDLDWGNAAQLFVSQGWVDAIAYDEVSNVLWAGNGSNVYEYSLGGTQLSMWTTPGFSNQGLAWEPSTDTLWTFTQHSNTFRQYDKTGNLLATIPFPNPFSDNFLGGEFEIGGSGPPSSCMITAPAAGATVSGDVTVEFAAFAAMMIPSLDASFDFSTDGGGTWIAATAAATSPLPNPATGVPAPIMTASFEWDSVADGVATGMVTATLVRCTVDDGMAQPSCQVSVMVDNLPPPIACMLTLPPGTGGGAIDVALDSSSTSSPSLTATLTFSTDGGGTYAFATMTAGSPNPNPSVVATGPASFEWDSRADGIGLVGPAIGVILRARVDDPLSLLSAFCSDTTDIDNTQVCGLCGDCNLDAAGPNILDALTAAQVAAGLVAPAPTQEACCDVDTSGAVSVLDSLLIAQHSAGLAVVLTCV